MGAPEAEKTNKKREIKKKAREQNLGSIAAAMLQANTGLPQLQRPRDRRG